MSHGTEKVRITPLNGKRLTIYLEITDETNLWLIGRELDRGGEWINVKGNGKKSVQVIDKSCIVKRTPVKLNLTYGEFEEIK